MSALLPPAFAALEPWAADWAIADGHARYLKRVHSTMAELQAFYDAVFPHGEAAIAFIDQYDYGAALPPEVARLRDLVYMLITVALAVEVWKQPRVKNSASTVLTRLA